MESLEFLHSEFIKPNLVKPRDYQMELAEHAFKKNSLIVLPTGLGKTLIALITAVRILESSPIDTKVIILAPTRPLIAQHFEVFKKFLTIPEDRIIFLIGSISSKKRIQAFESGKVLFYTPETLRNDILQSRYTLNSVGLIVFDEAHRASGDYAYCSIANYYKTHNPDGRVLALTASPGSTKEKVETLCKNLNIDPCSVHIRDRNDEDVKKYLKPMKMMKIGVKPEPIMQNTLDLFSRMMNEALDELEKLGALKNIKVKEKEQITKTELLTLQKQYALAIKTDKSRENFQILSMLAQAQKIEHMISLTETQGLDLLLEYLESIYEKIKTLSASKADNALFYHPEIQELFSNLRKQKKENPKSLEHPKVAYLAKYISDKVQNNESSRILVFTKLRATVSLLVEKLNKYQGIRAQRFVGQAKKSSKDVGLSQRQQINLLQDFKNNSFNVLVSTNVAEEGLDIEECDAVVFYDNVGSEIRFIQRRGRTARTREGEVIILYCIGTSDEKLLHISMRKMKRMNEILSQQGTTNQKQDYENQSLLKYGQIFKISETPAIKQTPNENQQVNIQNAEKADTNEKYDEGQQKNQNQSRLSNPNNSTNEVQLTKVHFEKCLEPEAKNFDSIEKTSLYLTSNKLQVSKNIPMPYGIRTLIDSIGLDSTYSNDQDCSIIFQKKIKIVLIEPEQLLTIVKEKKSISTLESDNKAYENYLIFIDFISFTEEYQGHMQNIIFTVNQLKKETGIKIIPIRNKLELTILLKNILSKIKIQ